eukprot:TRINITY_DN3646_c0_g2_i1.p1 TRINITY_DN3646_c0_g2~~TRINITY_DN3646_c0_g2_i1.p1  ORF type:complete len:281 (+),score=125.05 TRINITY_DN3646_c0_g2_i1:151-993(+)
MAHIEDFLDAISTIPNEVKRSLYLIRSLDKSNKDGSAELAEAERNFISEAKRKLRERTDRDRDVEPAKLVEDPVALADIAAKRAKCQQIADEKVAIADQMHDYVAAHLRRLTRDLAVMDEMLETSGLRTGTAAAASLGGSGGSGSGSRFDEPIAMKGEEVAVKPERHEDLWVLGRVKEYDANSGLYLVMDEDDNSKDYKVDEADVVVLGSGTKLSKGESVMAVYPDTTSFYKAVISVPPRRGSQIHSTTASVQFEDDADDSGMTPHRVILTKHIMPLPNT